jgi:hypothetical protein
MANLLAEAGASEPQHSRLTFPSMWCKMVYMMTRVDKSYETVRASVSFSRDVYAFLGEVAARKRVSIAWIVREAVESYIHALTKQQSEPQVK